MLEFGSGAGEKIRILLRALESPRAYLPVDISREILMRSSGQLAEEFPALRILPCCMDYTEGSWKLLPPASGARRIIFFPGSTIGNFTREDASGFLRRLALAAGPIGAVLIGVDLQKDRTVLERAYDDSQGVTAAFNMNLLRRIRDELGVSVKLERFRHRAVYNEDERRIEMHLESLMPQAWKIGRRTVAFEAGETIHTENSYKYTMEGFRQLARAAGLHSRRTWTDENAWFSIHLLETQTLT